MKIFFKFIYQLLIIIEHTLFIGDLLALWANAEKHKIIGRHKHTAIMKIIFFIILRKDKIKKAVPKAKASGASFKLILTKNNTLFAIWLVENKKKLSPKKG